MILHQHGNRASQRRRRIRPPALRPLPPARQHRHGGSGLTQAPPRRARQTHQHADAVLARQQRQRIGEHARWEAGQGLGERAHAMGGEQLAQDVGAVHGYRRAQGALQGALETGRVQQHDNLLPARCRKERLNLADGRTSPGRDRASVKRTAQAGAWRWRHADAGRGPWRSPDEGGTCAVAASDAGFAGVDAAAASAPRQDTASARQRRRRQAGTKSCCGGRDAASRRGKAWHTWPGAGHRAGGAFSWTCASPAYTKVSPRAKQRRGAAVARAARTTARGGRCGRAPESQGVPTGVRSTPPLPAVAVAPSVWPSSAGWTGRARCRPG